LENSGSSFSFEPTVVVHQGNLLVHNLKKVKYSIDNILQLLREKDIFHLADIEFAVLEANGRLTVYKKSPKSAPTLEELGLVRQQSDLSSPRPYTQIRLLISRKIMPGWIRNCKHGVLAKTTSSTPPSMTRATFTFPMRHS